MMRSHTNIIFIALFISVMMFSHIHTTEAQETYSEQDAIQLASHHAMFAVGLSNNPDWTGAAYDTRNTYGIWHVEFWDASGNEIGWADVSPSRGRVYSYETYYDATGEQVLEAETAIRDFLSSDPEFTELVGEVSAYEALYVDYDPYNRWWYAYFDRGVDSLNLVVHFEGETPASLDNPELIYIGFNNILSYDEWHSASQAQAIALAYTQPEIAEQMRDNPNWTAVGDATEDNADLWTVWFTLGENTLAEATVDLLTREVVSYSLNNG